MKDQTRVIAALLIGAAAGAALGLLLAPEKGETVRDGIADYINDLVEAAKGKAQTATNTVKEYGNNAYDKARTRFSGAVDTAEDHIDEAKGSIKDVADQAARNYNGAKSKVKATADDWNDSIQNS